MFRLQKCIRCIKKNADLSLALKPMKNFDRYGIVNVDSDFTVSGFEEKAFRSEGTINGGVYIINNSLNKYFPKAEKFSFEKDFLEKKINQLNIKGFSFNEYFIDIGIPEDYQRAQNELAQFKN